MSSIAMCIFTADSIYRLPHAAACQSGLLIPIAICGGSSACRLPAKIYKSASGINEYATLGFASSAFAAASLFGEQWMREFATEDFSSRIDFSRFPPKPDPNRCVKNWEFPMIEM